MKKTNLIVFSRENIDDALRVVDAHIEKKINDDGTFTLLVVNEKNEPVSCHNCDRVITAEDIGNIAPGSRQFFCKRATCFSRYLIDKKM